MVADRASLPYTEGTSWPAILVMLQTVWRQSKMTFPSANLKCWEELVKNHCPDLSCNNTNPFTSTTFFKKNTVFAWPFANFSSAHFHLAIEKKLKSSWASGISCYYSPKRAGRRNIWVGKGEGLSADEEMQKANSFHNIGGQVSRILSQYYNIISWSYLCILNRGESLYKTIQEQSNCKGGNGS